MPEIHADPEMVAAAAEYAAGRIALGDVGVPVSRTESIGLSRAANGEARWTDHNVARCAKLLYWTAERAAASGDLAESRRYGRTAREITKLLEEKREGKHNHA